MENLGLYMLHVRLYCFYICKCIDRGKDKKKIGD